MARGEGLTDEQRWPWLGRVKGVLTRAAAAGEHAIVACSALKEPYRQFLAKDVPDIRFVFLAADEALLRERLSQRPGHFAGPAMLSSQLATVEPPDNALRLDAARPVEDLVGRIRADLGV